MVDKLSKLKDMMNLLNDGLSRADFETAFKALLEQFLRVEKELIKKNLKAVDTLTEVQRGLSDKLESSANRELGRASNELQGRLTAALAQQESGLNFIRDKVRKIKEGKDGKDGKNADETKIAKDVLSQIKLPEVQEETPEETRDKLESIQEEEEKLKIDAISELRKELDELKKMKVGGGGGGFSTLALDMHIIDDEAPVNSGDNTNFTLSHTPSPTGSLKLYKGGGRLRITEDYTLSGRTITLLIPLIAGEILLADYRI